MHSAWSIHRHCWRWQVFPDEPSNNQGYKWQEVQHNTYGPFVGWAGREHLLLNDDDCLQTPLWIIQTTISTADQTSGFCQTAVVTGMQEIFPATCRYILQHICVTHNLGPSVHCIIVHFNRHLNYFALLAPSISNIFICVPKDLSFLLILTTVTFTFQNLRCPPNYSCASGTFMMLKQY